MCQSVTHEPRPATSHHPPRHVTWHVTRVVTQPGTLLQMWPCVKISALSKFPLMVPTLPQLLPQKYFDALKNILMLQKIFKLTKLSGGCSRRWGWASGTCPRAAATSCCSTSCRATTSGTGEVTRSPARRSEGHITRGQNRAGTPTTAPPGWWRARRTPPRLTASTPTPTPPSLPSSWGSKWSPSRRWRWPTTSRTIPAR